VTGRFDIDSGVLCPAADSTVINFGGANIDGGTAADGRDFVETLTDEVWAKMDFANQIIPVSESSGGAGSGLVNAGETVHYGAEVAVGLLVNQWVKLKDLIRVDVSATWVQAYLSADRFPDGATGDNIKGNRTPYTPEWWLNSAITWQSTFGLGMRVGYSYTGQQFGDVQNSTTPSNDGQTGLIAAYHLVDGTLQFESKKLRSTFTITGKNLLDERYIASRRPQGIRVGMPRMIMFGWRFDF
jgi:Fe(3+) dicitrate transport protein